MVENLPSAENVPDGEILIPVGGQCLVTGCTRTSMPYGTDSKLCPFHSQRRNKGVPFDQIERKFDVGNNWYTDSNGYRVRETKRNGVKRKIAQHREVMESVIGRPLEKHEEVHHKNGNRADNRISNLELWSTSQPAGQRVEDKIAWAKEMLALYGEDWTQPYLLTDDAE